MALPGVLILPLERQFGWSAEDISGAVALRLLIYGLMAPFAASLIDRIGLRRVMIGAVVLIGAGLALSLWMNQVWQLALLWGVMVGVGAGLTALVLGAVVATRWFTARRGLALGVLTAGSAAGQLIFLPLAAWLERGWGWRAALCPTLAGLVAAAALVALLSRTGPADLGLAPYGEAVASAARPAPRHGGDSRRSAKSPARGAFWILAATFFICGLSTNGLIQTHFIALCSDFDVGSVTAASTLALMGAVRFRRHDRLGLAVRPLRQSRPAVRLLRPARPVADLPARLVVLGLRPVAVRRVLRPRLGRHRAADRAPDRRAFRPRARRRGVRLDLRRPHGRRGDRRLRRRLFAQRAANLPAGLLRRRRLCLVAASLVWLIEKRPAEATSPAQASA